MISRLILVVRKAFDALGASGKIPVSLGTRDFETKLESNGSEEVRLINIIFDKRNR